MMIKMNAYISLFLFISSFSIVHCVPDACQMLKHVSARQSAPLAPTCDCPDIQSRVICKKILEAPNPGMNDWGIAINETLVPWRAILKKRHHSFGLQGYRLSLLSAHFRQRSRWHKCSHQWWHLAEDCHHRHYCTSSCVCQVWFKLQLRFPVLGTLSLLPSSCFQHPCQYLYRCSYVWKVLHRSVDRPVGKWVRSHN